MSRKYELPYLLADIVTHETYERWLRRKAQQHVRHDRQRGNKTAIGELYRNAIHDAVKESGGLDAYTGEKLEWNLIGNTATMCQKKRGTATNTHFPCYPQLTMLVMEQDQPILKSAGGEPTTPKMASTYMSLCRFVEPCLNIRALLL